MIINGDIPDIGPRSFTLREIAAWQLEMKDPEYRKFYRRASLPLLQRGAVWKAYQVEVLWDSLLRGFPVGSFILSQFVHGTESKEAKYESKGGKSEQDPEFHILDGQQRANAIAVGFIDPTPSGRLDGDVSDAEYWPPDALWVDLNPIEQALKDRSFVFRMVTRSHPWGYRAANPRSKLQASDMRKWMNELKEVHSDQSFQLRVGQIPLRVAWPWEANAPIPFAFILEALLQPGEVGVTVWERVRERVETVPHPEKLRDGEVTWKGEALRLLKAPTEHMVRLADATTRVLRRTTIPGIIVESERLMGTEDLQMLFKRVNSEGTDLGPEELLYSMLKAHWPGAHRVVEKAASGLMGPSRVVLFAARLAIDELMEQDTSPNTPDFSRFRNLMRGSDKGSLVFQQRIARYIQEDSGSVFLTALQDARQLLCFDNDQAKSEDFRLPGILLANIAQQSPDIFFTALVWLARLRKMTSADPAWQPTDALSSSEHKAFVAAISLLHWFANKPDGCLKILWQEIKGAADTSELRNLWSMAIRKCFVIEEDQSIVALPPIPPSLLLQQINRSMSNYENWTAENWHAWSWDLNLKDLPLGDFRAWLESKVMHDGKQNELSGEDRLWPAMAWRQLVDKLFWQKEFLMFGQREYLGRWYPAHDPVQGGKLEDTNRPWDYDHIMPSHYVSYKRNLPKAIKQWPWTIGNFRIWPMEANRSDGKEVPAKKLWNREEDLDPSYGLSSPEMVQTASLVDGPWSRDLLGDQLAPWKESSPAVEDNRSRYLADDENISCRYALLLAIANRTVSIYKKWYDELSVESIA